jgi:tRNA A-37 threonylcarbamoyl transferase component Bud32
MTELGRLGRYRLLRRIAVGGVAEVYLAASEGLAGFSKKVVVKRLYAEHARDPDLVAMFLDEARLGALLHDPYIVEVYDIGTEGGEYFIAMEHVSGRDLRDLLNARPGEPLPLPAALAIVQAVAAGLHHAHERRDPGGQQLGVVHRDVTPANVLLGWDGVVKLSDFGVAKWAEQRSRTEQGTLKGKLSYMSPEQCRGLALDRRSDVFALGVLLYELTTGDRPFRAASDFETLSAIVAGRYDAPTEDRPGYPAALEAVVRRALETDPDRRFPDAAALGAALAEVAGELGARGGPADVARCLAERFPEAETTPEPVEVASLAPTAASPASPSPAAAERTRTDAASSGVGTAVVVAAQAMVPRRPRSRAVALAGLAVVAVAGSVAVLLAVSSPPAPPSTVRPTEPMPRSGAVRAPAPAAAPVTSAPVPAPAVVPAPEAPAATAPPAPPARRRAAPHPRPPEGQTVWDPDSAKLP